MQRLLSAATAVSALPLGLEIFVNHYGGSFGNKWMWTPVVLSPALSAAGVAGVVSERAATTVLPALSAVFFLDGAAGVYFHLRGVGAQAGRAARGDLQPRHGPAGAGAGRAGHGRRAASRPRAAGALMAQRREPPHLPTARRPTGRSCRASARDDAADARPLPRLRRPDDAAHWDVDAR